MTTKHKTVTIYCASAADLAPIYISAAKALAKALVRQGVDIVTGGGRTGLMGAVADETLAAGGHITGIIPRFMVERGWHHTGLSELRLVDSMHERKAMMAAMSDAAIALPGGIGTFEELLEITTWRQLGLFKGNVVVYNVGGYYDPLLSMFDTAIEKGFMRPDHRSLFTVCESADETVTAALAEPSAQKFSAKF